MSADIGKIIEASGNDLQHQIADLLANNGWSVQMSPYYNDLVTGKSREIDIIALKTVNIISSIGGLRETVTFRLFIECKYIKNPIVFWMAKKDLAKAKLFAKDNPVLMHKDDRDIYGYLDVSHYLKDQEVIKNWAGDGKDTIFEAWNQSLNAMIFYQHEGSSSHYTVDFPMVVVDSLANLHKREPEEPGKPQSSKIEHDLQLEVDYSYKDFKDRHITKNFLIDLVSAERLEEFLKGLEQQDFARLKSSVQADLNESDFQRQRNGNDSFDPYSMF